MLTKEQLDARRNGIASTDVAKIVGVSPYGTKHNVYCDKKGLTEPRPDTLHTRIGNTVERLIVELYEEETKAVTKPSGTIVHRDDPWRLGTPDRLAYTPEGNPLLEIKWVGWRLAHHFAPCADDSTKCASCGNREGYHWGREEDAVPDYVRCQCEWLMDVSNTESCHVAALLGGDEFRIYRLMPNLKLRNRLVDVCRAFWFDNVVAGAPPAIDGSEGASMLAACLFPKERKPLMPAPPEAAKWMRKRARASRAIDLGERIKTEAESNLRLIIGEAEGIVGDFGKVTCKKQRNAKQRVLRFYPKRKEVA